MNTRELIEKIKKIAIDTPFQNSKIVDHLEVIKLIEQLDEPEKVKIPQFVANWIEHFKKTSDWDLFQAMDYLFEHTITCEWIETKDNQELFARAWIDGYEVEKEPKYTVKFKATNQYLCDDDCIGLHISPSFRSNFRKSDLEKLSLTEVFDSPLFEVEEV